MPNKMQRFTQHARHILTKAQDIAETMQHDHIYAAHVLLALAREKDRLPGEILATLQLDPAALADTLVDKYPALTTGSMLDLSADTKKTLEQAVIEVSRRRDTDIDDTHLLLGTLIAPDVILLLQQQDITPAAIREQIDQSTNDE